MLPYTSDYRPTRVPVVTWALLGITTLASVWVLLADRLYGPGPVAQALDDGLGTLAALGINTVEFAGWGDLSGEIAARANTFGINRFQAGVDAPPSLFDWDYSYTGLMRVNEWARQQAG